MLDGLVAAEWAGCAPFGSSVSREASLVQYSQLVPETDGQTIVFFSRTRAYPECLPGSVLQSFLELRTSFVHLRPHVSVFKVNVVFPGLFDLVESDGTTSVHEEVCRQHHEHRVPRERPLLTWSPFFAQQRLNLLRIQPLSCFTSIFHLWAEANRSMKFPFLFDAREVGVDFAGLQLPREREERSHLLELRLGRSLFISHKHQSVHHVVGEEVNFVRSREQVASKLVGLVPASDRLHPVALQLLPNFSFLPHEMQAFPVVFYRGRSFELHQRVRFSSSFPSSFRNFPSTSFVTFATSSNHHPPLRTCLKT